MQLCKLKKKLGQLKLGLQKTNLEKDQEFFETKTIINFEDCEKKIKEETKASTRCLPLDAKEESGNCVYCGSPAKHKWLFAQAY